MCIRDREPTVVEGIRTKMMAADPVAANHVRLMFEMYAEPETSFGDITRYFEEQGIKIYGKSLTRPFLSQLLRNLSLIHIYSLGTTTEKVPSELSYNKLRLNVQTHECLLDGEPVSLTPTEFSILHVLLDVYKRQA